MSILKAMQCYATGQLSKLSDDELEHMQDTVITKINDVKNMSRIFDIGPELKSDLREYGLIRETIALELEKRQSPANSQAL
jgi:hypothetical protein